MFTTWIASIVEAAILLGVRNALDKLGIKPDQSAPACLVLESGGENTPAIEAGPGKRGRKAE